MSVLGKVHTDNRIKSKQVKNMWFKSPQILINPLTFNVTYYVQVTTVTKTLFYKICAGKILCYGFTVKISLTDASALSTYEDNNFVNYNT